MATETKYSRAQLQEQVDGLARKLNAARGELLSIKGKENNTPQHWVAMAVDVLTGSAQILDAAKLDWGGSWSEWDQSIRDGITKLLKEHYATRC